ncbi:cell division ATP-binding protein FtsE [Candidatus Roizmanbacteria bacterium RIFCSPLOWO2_01_FULL_38_12]|uniref:Cell division ATP-binding protein FtsE n=1 Tax=Candidatus Roizmanbacteria bacterium RIFCSPLOWO2_01_FULL_38_12 TaxID=1802061 RepID=A0A1F7IVS8_9BACT|nr:MAG: cell division ATP-binding protein FtsE [Candidatus Roizmanbacteria bacterium RIFCSPHIGHO2_01_FULL_38_15]OGK36126.1 MAG: cell division ATP-binding protein FtsE [Candidatus Roizmanbacteria bacterium RIFCSPHIGHO2_12_FULL_38_13]OGK47477.1 MAG: cell division ATP-binding protein FtsE [Candidatus Roizmanbacteria bacterium RIFCSPLOWO2_01_FULL_38_12]
MIIFQNVTVKYPYGNLALNDVSFEIADNEFVYLVGPSGAGKTTILRLLLREITPASGQVTLDNEEISSKKFHDLTTLRQKIGIVFQDFRVLNDKNVYENVALSMRIKGYAASEIKSQVVEALELTGIEDKIFMFPSQLSAGELQRVAIARAIVGERSILLADEPTGNLDPKTTWDVMKIFKKLEKKRTILFATHNTDIVNSMQRRVIVVKNGAIVKDQRKGKYEL